MLQALRRPLVVALATLLAAGALAGCSGSTNKPKYTYDNPTAKGSGAPAKLETVRIGFLPLPDALPLWKAEKEGYWPTAGVYVELVPFEKDGELRQAFADGKVDGALLDLVQAVGLKAGGLDLQVTGVALGQTPAEGAMQIVSMSDKYKTASDLKGVRIEVTKGTDEEYAAEQMLLAAGLKPEEISLAYSGSDDDRTRAMLSKSLHVGLLPEKFAFIALGRGGHLISSDTQAKRSLSQTVYAFRSERLTAKTDAINRFFQGYNWAVADTMLKKEGLADLLRDNVKLSAAEATLYPIPHFPGAAVPTKESVEAVAQWLLAKGMIKAAPAYDTVVNASVLPPIK
ncbi:MAG TPA: ABC transporter substrate-binding protein [Symbiobacteriaceae bacterium]|nr:ABC transporter substrate-binding protein [Symbiobacteriaceae bacterium]